MLQTFSDNFALAIIYLMYCALLHVLRSWGHYFNLKSELLLYCVSMVLGDFTNIKSLDINMKKCHTCSTMRFIPFLVTYFGFKMLYILNLISMTCYILNITKLRKKLSYWLSWHLFVKTTSTWLWWGHFWNLSLTKSEIRTVNWIYKNKISGTL